MQSEGAMLVRIVQLVLDLGGKDVVATGVARRAASVACVDLVLGSFSG
jgi:hypothetical protein